MPAFLHKPTRRMNTLAGRSSFAHGYPRGQRANSGIFSIPEPTSVGPGAQNRAESPVFDRQSLEDRLFFSECGLRRSPIAQNPVCRHPRMLKTPKNARRSLPQPQAFAARRRIASASPVTAGGPGASDESSPSRGYSSPKLMPNALASRTRSLWGSTYLSLPATSSSGMWHILPSRRAIM